MRRGKRGERGEKVQEDWKKKVRDMVWWERDEKERGRKEFGKRSGRGKRVFRLASTTSTV